MRIYVALLMLMLAGCSSSLKRTSPEATETGVPFKEHQKQISSIEQWNAKGRFAVTHGHKGGNASFVWQQVNDHFQIKLHGPFGSGAIMIMGTPKYVHAQEANGKRHQANSPEQLMRQLVGWYVPISGLQYWIRGIPIPSLPFSHTQFNDEGLLKQFHQDGWTIHYDEYVFSGYNLPKRIMLLNPKLKIKLIVTSWDH